MAVELVGEERVRQSQAQLQDATQATLAGAGVASVVSCPRQPHPCMPPFQILVLPCMSSDITLTDLHGMQASCELLADMLASLPRRGRQARCAAWRQIWRSWTWRPACCPAGQKRPNWRLSCPRCKRST